MHWRTAIPALAIFLLAASSPSQTQKQREASDHQQDAAGIQKDAAKSAGVVALPTPRPQASDSDEDTWNCWDSIAPATWSTWVLALVAGVAAWIALRTLKAIQEQVEIGNQTVQETQKEFSARYRPHIRARNVNTDFSQMDRSNAGRLYPIEVTFHIVNYGESGASVIEAKAFIQMGLDFAILPMKPAYERTINLLLQIPDARLDSGQGIEMRVKGEPYPLLAVLHNNHPLRLIGYINYRGPLTDIVYRTAFARRYSVAEGRFVAEENPDYEYEE